ncbi:uncharacterized protein LOC111057307 [Nilaparvata lugens]|uniref:uncharacterized protein LOC111057307 n=1 Tax=Nilaparvata lugens TaxID=108931 RepID=UPI00193E7C27|nr:uncharacterized protein LOC111057307 [Nilaparvata lugens]
MLDLTNEVIGNMWRYCCTSFHNGAGITVPISVFLVLISLYMAFVFDWTKKRETSLQAIPENYAMKLNYTEAVPKHHTMCNHRLSGRHVLGCVQCEQYAKGVRVSITDLKYMKLH